MSVILTGQIYFAQVHFQTFHLPSYRRNFINLYQSFECRNDQVFLAYFQSMKANRISKICFFVQFASKHL